MTKYLLNLKDIFVKRQILLIVDPKLIWNTIVYEMCYINKLALPCLDFAYYSYYFCQIKVW